MINIDNKMYELAEFIVLDTEVHIEDNLFFVKFEDMSDFTKSLNDILGDVLTERELLCVIKNEVICIDIKDLLNFAFDEDKDEDIYNNFVKLLNGDDVITK